ncbi:hypothetical protein IWQ60_002608 [Tieghemiomyces parasiticus]|uniref:Uncharacterized protein n=1 Tax=Tieghemiomyces parasiticus TaxID=78921 RepID=A0A9W8AIR9_9FUNG|nr:hypothetical protein IWQ60_002608 [Tieghemiomyces parasiticus]
MSSVERRNSSSAQPALGGTLGSPPAVSGIPTFASSVPMSIPAASHRRASIHTLAGLSSINTSLPFTPPNSASGGNGIPLSADSVQQQLAMAPSSLSPASPFFAHSLPSKGGIPPSVSPFAMATSPPGGGNGESFATSPPAPRNAPHRQSFSGFSSPFRRMSYSQATPVPPPNSLAERSPVATGGLGNQGPASHYTPRQATVAEHPAPESMAADMTSTLPRVDKLRRTRTQPSRPESPMGKMILSGQFLD